MQADLDTCNYFTNLELPKFKEYSNSDTETDPRHKPDFVGK